MTNDLIRRNLLALHEAGAKVLLRCPIIPGLNDRADHFEGIASLCRELPDLAGVELLAYHRLGLGKIERLGADDDKPPAWQMPPRDAIQRWADTLRQMGVPVINSL